MRLHPKHRIRIREATRLVFTMEQTELEEHVDKPYRYIPPVLDKERSNIENSENTALFLVSCFQYILSAVVLSVGPPFRQTMANNRKLAHVSEMEVAY